jgi:hypothetical protein
MTYGTILLGNLTNNNEIFLQKKKGKLLKLWQGLRKEGHVQNGLRSSYTNSTQNLLSLITKHGNVSDKLKGS